MENPDTSGVKRFRLNRLKKSVVIHIWIGIFKIQKYSFNEKNFFFLESLIDFLQNTHGYFSQRFKDYVCPFLWSLRGMTQLSFRVSVENDFLEEEICIPCHGLYTETTIQLISSRLLTLCQSYNHINDPLISSIIISHLIIGNSHK